MIRAGNGKLNEMCNVQTIRTMNYCDVSVVTVCGYGLFVPDAKIQIFLLQMMVLVYFFKKSCRDYNILSV